MGIKYNPNALVKACADLLRIRGIVALRVNGGAFKVGRRLVRCTDTPGVSDLLAVLPPSGRLLAVECKTGDGRPSPAQLAFLAAVEQAGGLALVVRSVADLERALQLEGIGT